MSFPITLQNIFLYLFFTSILKVTAQNNPSALFQNWITAQQNTTEPVLPNFSYAGYHNGEIGIPNPSYRVFDVTDPVYGATPNDNVSDKSAIMATIAAAEAHGSGIVFFPPGEFLINETTDNVDEIIYIRKSNIILKGSGSGSGGTILKQNNYTNPTDPAKLYSCPYLIQFRPEYTSRPILTQITANTIRETFSVQVASTSKINIGDWVSLKLADNNTTLLSEEFAPYTVVPEYTSIANEINTWEIHKIAAINGNIVTFVEPIHKTINSSYNWYLEKITLIEEVGIQDLAYQGGFTKSFVHHESFIDDSGWSGVQFQMVANSWMYNVHFSDMSNAGNIKISANCSALLNEYNGNPGHSFISASVSTSSVIGLNKDNSTGIHHGCGVSGSSIGNVLWFNEMPTNGNSGIEIHASQPRCNLIDFCKGGLGMNYGGTEQNQPNHLRHLVIWNFEGKGYVDSNFEFWRNNYTYVKIIPPIVSGLVGFSISEDTSQSISGIDKQYQENESPGLHVDEESLYQEQLKYRLGLVPEWVSDLRKVKSIKTNISILKIFVNQSAPLNAIVFPNFAVDKSFTWSSNNETIAKVSMDGVVTGISSGTTQIIATTTDGNHTAATDIIVSSLGNPITHVETFENMDFEGWSEKSYLGDNGFIWNIDAKSTNAYIEDSKCIYIQSGKTGAFSENIPGGISSFTVTCRDLWNAGLERSLQLIINGTVIDTFTHTGSENYIFNVENIDIEGEVSIVFKNNSSKQTNATIAIDNLSWTTYNSDIAGIASVSVQKKIRIFPNPAANDINIYISDNKINIKQQSLYNFAGNKLYTGSSGNKVDASKYPKGIYLLKIETNMGVITKKVIIE
jgi:hypothetical protein